eukprot:85280_1
MALATRSRLSLWMMLWISVVAIYIIITLLSTGYTTKTETMPSISQYVHKSNISHPLLEIHSQYQQYLTDTILPRPFTLTCESFNDLCIKYKVFLNHINCIETITLLERDFESNHTISPLFILSFRREFMSFILSVPQTHQCLDAFCNLFKVIHQSNYHNTQKLILSHLHVSKAAGSTVEVQQRVMINRMFNNTPTFKDKVRAMHNLKHTAYIFDGFHEPKLQQNYFACDKLYTKLAASKILRFSTEIPLTSEGICEQFYNSVVIREPITHSLSLLAYKTHKMYNANGGILCKQNRSSRSWSNPKFPCHVQNPVSMFNYTKCHKAQQMRGLITDLFNETAIETPNDVVGKWECDSKCEEVKGRRKQCKKPFWQPIPEYFNDNFKFGTVYHQRWYIGTKKKFDARQLRAWMSNTFVRYLGYNLVENDVNELYFENNSFVFNAMLVDFKNVKEKHLDAAMKILLQFDYVLPVSGDRQLDYVVDVERKIWNLFWIESKRVLSQNKYDMQSIINRKHPFDNDEHSEKPRSRATSYRQIGTNNLYEIFGKTGELETLLQLNQLDLKLFQWSKFVAYLDLIFYQHIFV